MIHTQSQPKVGLDHIAQKKHSPPSLRLHQRISNGKVIHRLGNQNPSRAIKAGDPFINKKINFDIRNQQHDSQPFLQPRGSNMQTRVIDMLLLEK
jgi:hypothetical protein